MNLVLTLLSCWDYFSVWPLCCTFQWKTFLFYYYSFPSFCQECPVGTYKNVDGSDARLCTPCSVDLLPRRAEFIYVRGTLMIVILFLIVESLLFHSNFCYWAFISQKDAHLLQEGWLIHHVPINAYLKNMGCRIAILLLRSFCIPLGGPGLLQFYCLAFWCFWVYY